MEANKLHISWQGQSVRIGTIQITFRVFVAGGKFGKKSKMRFQSNQTQKKFLLRSNQLHHVNL
jgi:hypothetical protein